MEMLIRHDIDFVSRMKDEKAKKLLGNKNEIIQKLKITEKPKDLNETEKSLISDYIIVRIIKYCIPRKGHRSQIVYIVTSLLKDEEYSTEDITELYAQRWGVELDLRNLKITIGAKELKCKNPSMVEKELWVKIITYNLIKYVSNFF
jgi:IS4 transposase